MCAMHLHGASEGSLNTTKINPTLNLVEWYFSYSDDIIALELAKPDAIQEWRDIMGPTNATRAKQEAPNTLRAKYGHDQTRNALHGSDSYLSAEREIKFFFPEGTLTYKYWNNVHTCSIVNPQL